MKDRDAQRAKRRQEREGQRQQALDLYFATCSNRWSEGKLNGSEIAARVGIDRRTFFRWRKTPDFTDAYQRGYEIFLAKLRADDEQRSREKRANMARLREERALARCYDD